MTDREAFEKLLKGEKVSVSYNQPMVNDDRRLVIGILDSTLHLNEKGMLETETGELFCDKHEIYYSEAHKAKLTDKEKRWLLTVSQIFEKITYIMKDNDNAYGGGGSITIYGMAKTQNFFHLIVALADTHLGDTPFESMEIAYSYTPEALGLCNQD